MIYITNNAVNKVVSLFLKTKQNKAAFSCYEVYRQTLQPTLITLSFNVTPLRKLISFEIALWSASSAWGFDTRLMLGEGETSQ